MQEPDYRAEDAAKAATSEDQGQTVPPAAENEGPQPAAAEKNASASDKGGSNEKRRAEERPRRQRPTGSGGSTAENGNTSAADPDSIKERLLAPLKIPEPDLDRGLLPTNLLQVFDAAGLGAPNTLQAAALMTLAAVSAVAGPGVRCEAHGDLRTVLGSGTNIGLRVALIAQDRRQPLVPSAVIAAAHAAENDAINLYEQRSQLDAEQRRLTVRRRRLQDKAWEAATLLGIPIPSITPEVAPAKHGVRPRLVIRDGAAAAVKLAAAGGGGVLVVDERRMPSMTRVANFFDEPTETLLTALARGNIVPIVDPTSGRTEMRSLPAAVIGVLILADCALLHEVTASSYLATAFVPAVPPPAGDCTALVALMRRVAAIGREGITLGLSQRETLRIAAKDWAAEARYAQPPLSDYLAHLPDLSRRPAAALHLAAAAGDDKKLKEDIPHAIVAKVIHLIRIYFRPIARAILSPISTSERFRDGRRIVTHLRATTSTKHNVFERRTLLRSWQSSMSTKRLDATIHLLQQAEILRAIEKSGSQQYEVAPEVFKR